MEALDIVGFAAAIDMFYWLGYSTASSMRGYTAAAIW